MGRIRICPKCMSIIKKNDVVCPSCGMPVSEMYNINKGPKKEVVQSEEESKLTKKEKRFLEENKDIDFADKLLEKEDETENAIDETRDEVEVEEETIKPKRHKHKRKQKDPSNFTVDGEGTYDINTNDVTFFEGKNTQEYSVKKARGELKEEKIQWWEIYKWADKLLARRKIMKEVNKAARVKPDYVNKTTLLILCVLFGWMGGHNFYARNYKKGLTMLILLVVSLIVIQVDILSYYVGVAIGGGFGFVVIFAWIYDTIGILFNKYKYRTSKMQFISKLNASTRAKLGKRYIDIKKEKSKI